MATLSDNPRSRSPHESFAFFSGLLVMFTVGYGMAAVAGWLWGDASRWTILVYAGQCILVLLCLAYATGTRAEHKTVLWLTLVLIGAHFLAFALPRLMWETRPASLAEALLAVRVLYYFAAGSVGFGLACIVLFRQYREVLQASILPGGLMTAGAWWVLRDTNQASQVVTSIGMGLGLVVFGLLSLALCQSHWVRKVFSNRPKSYFANEMQHAKRVHESMFPEPIADEDFSFGYAYRPMRQIGGDFIHIHREARSPGGGDALYLTLIDVTGHGITSALTVNRLHAEMQQYFGTASSPCPSEVLGHLNEYVRLSMAEHGLFATGMCVRLETAAGTMTVANAGHPLCFVRSSEGLKEIDAQGPMLGVFPAATFDSTPVSFPFAAGDQMVMVTDGAIEARSTADEMLGTERLRRIIERSCLQAASPVGERGDASLLQKRISGRLLDRADVRKPVGLIQQVLRQRMNAHPCALADEIMLSIDDFVQQDNQDDILIATIELLKATPEHPAMHGSASQAKPSFVSQVNA
jgi:serine phosphatase RsbU (regulator of sigma subunit)